MIPLADSFLVGVVNSLHCALMCGPLALSVHAGSGGALAYHVGRLISYGALGVVLGAVGSHLGSGELATPTAWVAFVLAAGLVLLALFGDRGAVKLPWIGGLLQRGLRRAQRLPPQRRGALLGLLTPLLPCSVLWYALAGAAVAGSWFGGGQVMLGFALGSLPLLFLAQSQALVLSRRFGPRTLQWIQRTAILTAAAVLVWRGVAVLQSGSCCG